jgi:hypothetical protein
MKCSLALALTCSININTDSLTESVFPITEELIRTREGMQALKEITKTTKNKKKYRSVMDLLFCTIHPLYQQLCFTFYDDNGSQLKDSGIFTEEEVNMIDVNMAARVKRITDRLKIMRAVHFE